MNVEDSIKLLLEEGDTHTFGNNSRVKNNTRYGSVSSDFQAWNAKVEDLIIEYYGNDSRPMKVLSRLNIDEITGNYAEVFDEQHAIIIGALKACKAIKPKYGNQPIVKNDTTTDGHSVFIVHGHDDLATTLTARFIEQLGLKPIILREQASSGKTIIEKIETYSSVVGFGIVLYTPCDLGGKTEGTLKARARQNVVFEHGYLIGKIGRENVCALVKGVIETPNDISGVVYVPMDDATAWHFQVAKELRNSGYEIDMNKL